MSGLWQHVEARRRRREAETVRRSAIEAELRAVRRDTYARTLQALRSFDFRGDDPLIDKATFADDIARRLPDLQRQVEAVDLVGGQRVRHAAASVKGAANALAAYSIRVLDRQASSRDHEARVNAEANFFLGLDALADLMRAETLAGTPGAAAPAAPDTGSAGE